MLFLKDAHEGFLYSKVQAPSQKILAGDVKFSSDSGATTDGKGYFDHTNYFDNLATRHGGKANVLYADFHVNKVDPLPKTPAFQKSFMLD